MPNRLRLLPVWTYGESPRYVGIILFLSASPPRSRTFEVHAVLVKTAAMAGAFELLFRFQPVRRASQVRANGFQGEDLRLPFVLVLYHPDAELSLEPFVHLTRRQGVREADFELGRRFGEDIREEIASEAQHPE